MPPIPPETNTIRGMTGCERSRQLSSCGASIKPASSFIFSFLTLDGEGDAHATADAKRGKPALGVPLLHFMEQRDKHARTRCTDRMTERDGPAVHVHLLRVPAHLPIDRDRLRCERFVDLEQIEVFHVPSRAREAALGSGYRPHAHVFGVDARRSKGLDARE